MRLGLGHQWAGLGSTGGASTTSIGGLDASGSSIGGLEAFGLSIGGAWLDSDRETIGGAAISRSVARSGGKGGGVAIS